MNLSVLRRCATMCLLIGPAMAQADQDPCNFNDGSEAFSYERVMSCYESVPFNPGDRDNAVAFIRAARERSDLREIMQARYGWREELQSLATRTFANDHDFQLALVDNHKRFYNPHWRYQRPYCYTAWLAAFMPFDFGSAVLTSRTGGRPEQIIFIEAAPYRGDLYRSFTGIDPEAYVGARVLSVNGQPVLEYFREFGRNVYRFDENDGENLNEILQNAAYSIRSSYTHDVPPDRSSDVFVLETRAGERLTVEIPWVFAPRGAFGLFQWALSDSESTAAFQFQCLYPSDVSFVADWVVPGDPASDAARGHAGAASRGSDAFQREIAEKRMMAKRLEDANPGRRADYFEASPGQKSQQVTVVVPKNDGAVAYQLSDRATVIRLDDFVQDWKDEVIAATDYACANSDRLIVDMRNNSGGYVDYISWLTTHLLPSRTAMRDHTLGGRFLMSDAGRNELVERQSRWTREEGPYYGIEQCWWGYEPGCFVDPASEQPLGDDGWSQGNAVESRGGRDELLSRSVLFRNFDSEYSQGNPIACPGKFKGSNLIIFSNGTGASAGYFWPEMMRPDATIVTSGGFLGEPLVHGIARGGAVWGMNNFEAWTEQYLELWYGVATNPLPFFVRRVDSFMEQPASYMRGSPSLYVNSPARGDVHVDVWSDSRRTDGFVYQKVLEAAQSSKSRKSR